MNKLKLIFIILVLVLITGCTSGSLSNEDINKIATNPIVKQQINEIIKSNCFSVDKVKEGGVIHYFVTPRDCNYTLKYNYDPIIKNSTENLIIIGENETEIIRL